MKFTSMDRGGGDESFKDAVLHGIPAGGGYFVPQGGVDLRTLVYSPRSTYLESVKTAIAILLSEDFDPVEAEQLAKKVFPRKPDCIQSGNILVFDLASGKSGSAFDYGAELFMATIRSYSAGSTRKAIPILAAYPEGRSSEARVSRAVLAARFDSADPGAGMAPRRSPTHSQESLPEIVLLRSSGEVGIQVSPHPAIPQGTRIVDVPCDARQIPSMIRNFTTEYPGICIPALPDNPAFFMAALILESAMFAEGKNDFSGEIFFTHSSLAASWLSPSLWSWGLGLPVTGFILGAMSGTAQYYSADPSIADFERMKPGILSSLSLLEKMDEAEMNVILATMPELRSLGLAFEDRVSVAAGKKAVQGAEIASSPESARIIARRIAAPVEYVHDAVESAPLEPCSDSRGFAILADFLRSLAR